MLSRLVSLNAYNQATQLIANQKSESSPENGTLTGINTGLGCPPDPHQFNDSEDEDRDGLRNAGLHKTEPHYPADSPKELHCISHLSHAYYLLSVSSKFDVGVQDVSGVSRFSQR
jgi:hypothetical protein